jgi:tetratricopeptide (TPR) repeat protein
MTELPDTTYDPATLHEAFVDPAAAGAVADELRTEVRAAPDEVAELMSRGDLVDALRTLGRDDDAVNEGLAAVDRADIAGTHAQQHTARVRLARVHQWRGEFGDANALFTELLAAATQFGPVVEAYTRQHAGENDFAQGHFADARDQFARALEIRGELELDDAARSRVALSAAEVGVAATADRPDDDRAPGEDA